nr:unnamed protein product [Callosobruchus chinensis]
MWTDETKFTRAVLVNHRNDQLWMEEYPRGVRTRTFQHQFSVNFWTN